MKKKWCVYEGIGEWPQLTRVITEYPKEETYLLWDVHFKRHVILQNNNGGNITITRFNNHKDALAFYKERWGVAESLGAGADLPF